MAVDLVVVGAGAAGLAAARAARERGLATVVFEAMGRTGGRALTDTATFGVPWDRGCHWLHSAGLNPYRDLADGYGVRYRREPSAWRIRRDDRWASDAELEAADASYDRLTEAALAAGRAGRDVSLADVLDPAEPGYALFRAGVQAEWAQDPAAVSTLDYAAYRDTGEDWPVEDGYGALVARHHDGLAVELLTPVERIEWGGPRVRVATPAGTVEAGAVVVTVSTGVLAAGTIRFDPPLPDWKQEAVAAVPLGCANKVAFAVEGRHLGVDEPTEVLVPLPGGEAMFFRLRPFGRDLADGYLAGPPGQDLEDAGEAATLDAALAALTGALGGAVARHVTASACTRWGAEPSIRGAYAAARPGQAGLRADLARPLGDRVFFAGEATSPDFFSTCHGAHLSGIAAAEAAAAILGRTDAAPRAGRGLPGPWRGGTR